MLALVGVVLSYATFVAGASAGGAVAPDDVVLSSASGGPACETPSATATADDYATPAEVDCPAGTMGEAQSRLVVEQTRVPPAFWDCSPPVLDFHYRVSRAPESERPNGALRPQRARRSSPGVAAFTGLPLERGSPLSLGAVQPAAMYALFGLIAPGGTASRIGGTESRSTRALEPLDRPPRA